jgi:hypothetical protein
MGDKPAGWSASLVHSSPSSARGLPPLLTIVENEDDDIRQHDA